MIIHHHPGATGLATGQQLWWIYDGAETAAPAGPPTLSSPTGTATGPTSASGTVSTDQATGTLYWVATQSATTPSSVQIEAGQDNLGASADDSSSQAVSTSGVQNINSGGLAPSTTYYFHYTHENAATDDSTPVSSASFTTPAAGSDDFELRFRDGTYRRRYSWA